MNNKTQNYR
jgi:hypothetical protein